nr:hypothetical protein Iba_scaffold2019CG0040 [Ipomoea batatas]GME15304.1 hypothetical protein Iba_scaffold16071CG0010 [Ipomoea batatas]
MLCVYVHILCVLSSEPTITISDHHIVIFDPPFSSRLLPSAMPMPICCSSGIAAVASGKGFVISNGLWAGVIRNGLWVAA